MLSTLIQLKTISFVLQLIVKHIILLDHYLFITLIYYTLCFMGLLCRSDSHFHVFQ